MFDEIILKGLVRWIQDCFAAGHCICVLNHLQVSNHDTLALWLAPTLLCRIVDSAGNESRCKVLLCSNCPCSLALFKLLSAFYRQIDYLVFFPAICGLSVKA
jgi:hypothetical protein